MSIPPDGTAVLPVATVAAPIAVTPPGPNGNVHLHARYPQAGHVAQAPGGRAWLAAMFGRNRRGTIAGIIAAWFQVPLVVLMAAIGAVFGGLAGVFHGGVLGRAASSHIDTLMHWVLGLGPNLHAEDLVPTAGIQIGGIIGGILGAINGALTFGWYAISWPLEALYAADPVWPYTWALGQVVTALVVGWLYLAYRSAVEGSPPRRRRRWRRLRAIRAREP